MSCQKKGRRGEDLGTILAAAMTSAAVLSIAQRNEPRFSRIHSHVEGTMRYLPILLCLLLQSQLVFPQSSSLSEMPMKTIDNEPVTLKEYLGKGPVYMAFWALWCGPCKTELQFLQKMQERYGTQGLTILAIDHDTQKSLAKVRSYVAAKGYTFKVMIDPDSEIFQKLNGEQLPFSLLMDTNGTIVARRTGFLPGDEKGIEKEIKDALDSVSRLGKEN